CFRLIKGSLLGLILGIFVYLYMDLSMLKMIVGMIILLLTILLILQVTITRSATKDYFSGSLSGLLTTSIGVPGPPLLLYFSGTKMKKETLRSTTLAYYLFVYTAALVMQITFGGTNKMTWLASLLAIPPLFIGIWLGQRLFKWISQETFRKITYVILILTGIYLNITSI